MATGEERVAVIGLGYVGLPVALAFSEHFETVGFDINSARVAALREGQDSTREVERDTLLASELEVTSDSTTLADRTFYVVTVPTPIDANKQPDLTAIRAATEMVASHLTPGAVVVYESTVYPGVTEEVCGPIIERASGLVCGRDVFLAYSPERINPGDHEHTLARITKVVGAGDPVTLERVASAYGQIIEAGIHRAPSIRVAEAAKVIENTQRDLNIALMNELAIILDTLGVRTHDVLEAARTKWNFLPFRPGLVGGHCIGVDPYYLTAKATAVGYHPEVILAGRRINDGMGAFVAQKLVKLLVANGKPVAEARVAILGLTFKENVPDLRNSGVPRIAQELASFCIEPLVHDPLANSEEAEHHYGLTLTDWKALDSLDALILAVPHAHYLEMDVDELLAPLGSGGVLIDVCSALDPGKLPPAIQYWSL